jgi:predicted AlkP superfamily pyrophosphatase or phosphodiesterase
MKNRIQPINIIITCIIAAFLAASCSSDQTGEYESGISGIHHVIFIGVDALSPDGIRNAHTPNIDYLMQNGASTLSARAVMPTNSSPNWASMIMGAGPEQHGITSNSWEQDNYQITPTTWGPGGFFPTIFYALKNQKPELKLASFYDWPGFGRLFEQDYVDTIYMPDLPRETTDDRVLWAEDTMHAANEYIRSERPNFLFIQLDHVDHFGHRFAHGSMEYFNSVQHADSLIGTALAAIEESGIMDKTVIMISSDHGGIGTGHGGSTDDEILIPWIIYGAEVTPGLDLGPFINTYDTAATIAYIFGIEPPDGWIARPVKHAFN